MQTRIIFFSSLGFSILAGIYVNKLRGNNCVIHHVNVISLGGAQILHVLHVIETQLAECFIFVLVIHVETNNVNKIHIPEKSQLSKAKQDLDVLFATTV
jgi:hypothetical protein